jgi:hypothetical protein
MQYEETHHLLTFRRNQPLRESKDGIISLHGHPGGVNVIGVALHFIYTGECSVSQYTEDPIEGLRLRLHLFKLADFLDMKGPWLHMENLKCFDDEIWEIGFGKQLSSAVSLLYDTENASVPYIQECRKKFCGHFPAMLARKRQITESPDDGFWATFRSNMTFASDVAFELAKSNVQLQRIVGEKCQSADSG